MHVYHIGSTRYADQLTGEGAKLHGGRWNAIGSPCIYTAESISLSVLEYAANVPLELMPPSISVTVYSIPDKAIKLFKEEELPSNWSDVPSPVETKLFGTAFLKAAKYLAIKLPSVIISTEYNFILNPLHPDFKKVKIKEIKPFTFDGRIKQ